MAPTGFNGSREKRFAPDCIAIYMHIKCIIMHIILTIAMIYVARIYIIIYKYDSVAPGARRGSYCCFGRRGRAQLAGHEDTVIIFMRRYIIPIGKVAIFVPGKTMEMVTIMIIIVV